MNGPIDAQVLWNVAVVLIGSLGTLFIQGILRELRDLRASHDAMRAKIQEMDVLIAGQYVKTETFEKTVDAMFRKLDAIYDALQHKADK